jgi:acyl-coenzyme A synthetase/AMP-(fatty) acid ligase
MGNPLAIWISFAALLLAGATYAVTFAFFMGKMAQRVQALEEKAADGAGVHEDVIRLKVQMEAVLESLKSVDRHVSGMQRSLATLAARGAGGIQTFEEPSDGHR